MNDEPESLMLVFLRRLDTKMDTVIESLGDLKRRVTTLQIQVGNLVATEMSHYANTNLRIDHIEARLDRIERRLELQTV